MPVLPPSGAAPLDTVASVLNLARVRVNDAIQSIGGDTLTNTAPFTQVATNAAWRRMQSDLSDKGLNRLESEVILTGIPVTSNLDPASQCFIDWNGYFDGNSYFDTPALPGDLLIPLRTWERPTGQNWGTAPMVNFIDGLPSSMKQGFNFIWEWRDDKLFFPGALSVLDMRVRYAKFIPDFADTIGDQGQIVPWYNTPVPIVRCQDAFADYIAYEVTNARGDAAAAGFLVSGQLKANAIFNREARQKQRVNLRRIARSAGARCYGSGWIY